MFYLRTLDDTAWSIADVTGPIGTGTHIFDINFTANDQEFNSIRFVDGTESGQIYFDATLVNEYPRNGWVDAAYQNVKIAGGVDATNPSLLSWFRQNAKNLTPSNDDASITDALRNIADAISSGGGGGGSYFEETTLFDGTVAFVDGEGSTDVAAPEPTGELSVIIDNADAVLLSWDDSDEYWHNTEDTVEAYGDPLLLWVADIENGSHSVQLAHKVVSAEFAEAVNVAVGGETPSASNVPDTPDPASGAQWLALKNQRGERYDWTGVPIPQVQSEPRGDPLVFDNTSADYVRLISTEGSNPYRFQNINTATTAWLPIGNMAPFSALPFYLEAFSNLNETGLLTVHKTTGSLVGGTEKLTDLVGHTITITPQGGTYIISGINFTQIREQFAKYKPVLYLMDTNLSSPYRVFLLSSYAPTAITYTSTLIQGTDLVVAQITFSSGDTATYTVVTK